MQGIQGSFRGSDNWLTCKRARVVTGSGNCLTCKGSSVNAKDQTDMQGSQGSFRGSDNWQTCKEAGVDSQRKATDKHTKRKCSVRCQAADWHTREPVFSAVSGSWLTYKRASVQYGVRQLTDIQESQCSVRCQALTGMQGAQCSIRCQAADWLARELVFGTGSGSWLTYKRASVQYDIRQLTDIQESQCSIRCQAADCHAREPFFITASGSWLACKKVRVHSQGKATDMYESQDSVQGQAHRSPECGTSIVLGSVFRSQPKDRLCWFGIFCDCFQSHQTCNNRTSNWAVASSFPVRCSWLIILFLDAVGFEQWTAPAKKPENK